MNANTGDTYSVDNGGLFSPLRERALLLVGYLALVCAVGIAHVSPATGYEISVFGSTPATFWAAIAVSIGCALVGGFFAPTIRTRVWSLALGGKATVAIVGLPLLRGYAFYGRGDPLSHMGWTKAILGGELPLTGLIYPGVHTVSIFVHQVLGLPLGHAMLVASGIFVVLFLVSVPLLAYSITDSVDVAVAGAFSAMLLLPINNIGSHLTVFPSTSAIFFVPFALLLLVVYMTATESPNHPYAVSALLALTTFAIVLVHPLQAINLWIVFASVVLVCSLDRRLTGSSTSVRIPYAHTFVFGGVLLAWGASHHRIAKAATDYLDTFVETILGAGSMGTSAITQRTGSLAAIGASPVEVVLKLFLVSAVFLLLAALVVGAHLLYRDHTVGRRRTLLALGLALLPVGAVMILFVLGNLQTMYFRHFAFIMALVTVFGAIGIGLGVGRLRRRGSRLAIGCVAVVLAAMLVLSLVTVYSSPFIYKASGHVTNQELEGYDQAFTYEQAAVPYLGIRTSPDRFRDSIEGILSISPRSERVGNRVPFGSLAANLSSPNGSRYIPVSKADIDREVVAFQEYRYTRDGFESIPGIPGVDRVISNRGFSLYYVGE